MQRPAVVADAWPGRLAYNAPAEFIAMPQGRDMPKPGRRGLSRLLWATRYSIQGLGAAWRHESAFRQELVAAAVLIPVAFWIEAGPPARALLVASVLLVLVVELLNSAVEAVVDRFGEELNDLCGRAKDLGSAAVMLWR